MFNPITGIDLLSTIIPAGAALVVLVILIILGRKGKKNPPKPGEKDNDK